MVLGIGNSIPQRQLKQDERFRKEENDATLARDLVDPRNVAYDSQVSAMILDVNRHFLNWRFDEASQKWRLDEKYPFKEPYFDEPLSFMTDDERLILNQMDNSLSIIYNMVKKYEWDDRPDNAKWIMYWVGEFNTIVSARTAFLINSRTTGKASKVAKSMYVDSSASIRRGEYVGKKEGIFEKFFGG